MIDEVEAEVFEFNKYGKIFITHKLCIDKIKQKKICIFQNIPLGFHLWMMSYERYSSGSVRGLMLMSVFYWV